MATSDEFFFTSNAEDLRKKLLTIPGRAYLHMRPAFGQVCADFVSRFRQARLSGRPGLNRVTGSLSRSFNFVVTGTSLNTLSGIIFTDSKYAKIHQFGGTIRAKNFPYLYIPIFKGSAQALAAGLSTGKRVSRSSTVVSFRLVKQVFIPPRLGFLEMWQSPENVARINARLVAAARAALVEASNG